MVKIKVGIIGAGFEKITFALRKFHKKDGS